MSNFGLYRFFSTQLFFDPTFSYEHFSKKYFLAKNVLFVRYLSLKSSKSFHTDIIQVLFTHITTRSEHTCDVHARAPVARIEHTCDMRARAPLDHGTDPPPPSPTSPAT